MATTDPKHLAIFYRNFRALGYHHVGLGVNASIGARVLKRMGITVDIFGVRDAAQIKQILSSRPTITHVVLEAPWIYTDAVGDLLQTFPRIEFVMRVHSQFGFLQVEAGAIQLLREQLDLQQITLNFRVAGNSRRFCDAVEKAYGSECLYLPNLYDTHRPHQRFRNPHGYRAIKLASFGAIRLLKMHTTAASAALIAARERGCDLEFYMNKNREENGRGVTDAIRNLFSGLPWAKFIEVPWKPWPEFRAMVASMDACIQVSATETFNLVTADAACEGVPSVVSDVIEWAPDYWKAHLDDPNIIARTLNQLLSDPHAGRDGRRALEEYVRVGQYHWCSWFKGVAPFEEAPVY